MKPTHMLDDDEGDRDSARKSDNEDHKKLKNQSREEMCALVTAGRFGNGKLGNKAQQKQPRAKKAPPRNVNALVAVIAAKKAQRTRRARRVVAAATDELVSLAAKPSTWPPNVQKHHNRVPEENLCELVGA